MIHVKSFPGWKDFAAMRAHMKFFREHIQKIEKVAVAADGAWANIIPNIVKHFIHAQVRHLDFVDDDAAWDWLRQTGKAQIKPVA